MELFIFIAALLVILFFFLLRPGHSTKEQRAQLEGRNFAHRGLYRKDQSIPENSLPAFRLAAEKGYGIELDVQLTQDGQVVVFHDDLLDRMCGEGLGLLEQKTLQELQQLRLSGTEESIPLFREVLNTVGGRVPLIVELKSTSRYRELCEKTYALLQSYSGIYCMESFDVRIVRWLKKNAKPVLRGQLSCRMRELRGNRLGAFFLSRLLTDFIGRPQFIAYGVKKAPFLARLAQSMGAMTVVWTAHDTDNTKELEDMNDAVIFEHYLPKPVYFKAKNED